MGKITRGFTLIELLIVVSIIGLVATLGFGSYQVSLRRARDAQRKTDLSQIRSALEIWRADQGVYPAGGTAYRIRGCGGTCVRNGTGCTWGDAWTCGSPAATYMEKLPQDPRTVNYRYSSPTDSTYTLEACLENANDPQAVTPSLDWGATCASNKVYQVKNP